MKYSSYYIFTIALTLLGAYSFAQKGFLPENIEAINSEYEEINPVLSPDGKTIYFSRLNHYQNKYGTDGSQDIWYSHIDKKGNFSEPQRMSDSINIGRYNSLFAVTRDGKSFVIGGNYNKKGAKWKKRGLSIVRRTGDGWSTPEKIKVPLYTGNNEGYFSSVYMNNDETALLICYGSGVNSRKGNIFYCIKNRNGQWISPHKITILCSRYDEQAPFITNDLNTIYFSSNRDGAHGDYNIYSSKRLYANTWNDWSTPIMLSDTINSSGWDSYYRINEKGNYAYYASTNNSKGRSDIFRIKLYEDSPFILVKGNVVRKKDGTPFPSTDLSVLVNGNKVDSLILNTDSSSFAVNLPFGSQYKIFAKAPASISDTVLIDARQISEYQEFDKDIHLSEIPYAIVTGNIMIKGTNMIVPESNHPTVLVDGLEVDTAIVAPQESKYLLKMNTGYSYRVFVHADNYGTLLDTVNLVLTDPLDTIYKNLYVEDINTAMITGRILNMNTHKPIEPGKEIKILVNDHEYIKTIIPDTLYRYAINLKIGEKYTLNAIGENYLPVTEYIDLSAEKTKVKIIKDLNLVPVEVGKAVKLDNIFFETGSAKLKSESFPELNRVILFMRDNPKARIEISGHTDSQGGDAFNQKLSENRAQSVVNHILLSGIPKDNIIYKGYGESMPVAPNTTAAGRALNRRVEFKVLENK